MNQALPVVYLVRHADAACTLTVTAQQTGRTDFLLTEQGERQVRALGPTHTALRIDRILSSPLQRVRRSAELAMPTARVEVDDKLMEWDYGAYKGRRTAEIEVERHGRRLFRNGCPRGETLDSVGTRADRVIGRIRAEGVTTRESTAGECDLVRRFFALSRRVRCKTTNGRDGRSW